MGTSIPHRLAEATSSQNGPVTTYRIPPEIHRGRGRNPVAPTREVDGHLYSKSNYRLLYDPELHDRHGEPFTTEELMFLCSSWDGMLKADIAAALGRTHSSVLEKKKKLIKSGEFDFYANLGKTFT